MSEIDHEVTDNAVCPYCGYEHHDSWELGGPMQEDGETNCHSCDRAFYWSRHISVHYSTKKREPRS